MIVSPVFFPGSVVWEPNSIVSVPPPSFGYDPNRKLGEPEPDAAVDPSRRNGSAPTVALIAIFAVLFLLLKK